MEGLKASMRSRTFSTFPVYVKSVVTLVWRPVVGASYTWKSSEVARRLVLVELPKQSMVSLLLRIISSIKRSSKTTRESPEENIMKVQFSPDRQSAHLRRR